MARLEERDFAEALESTSVSLCETLKTKGERIACYRAIETVIGEEEAWMHIKNYEYLPIKDLAEAKTAIHTLRIVEEKD
jgi:hypothetical protein